MRVNERRERYLPYLEKDQGAQGTVKNSYRQWHSQLGHVQQVSWGIQGLKHNGTGNTGPAER